MERQPVRAMVAGVVVFFDLETTGLATKRCHILQLAAISGDRPFNRYIFPRRDIDGDASLINGLTVHEGDGFDRRSLLLHGRPVAAVPLRHALIDFMSFLRSFRAPLLLAAHSAKGFKVPVLTRSLRSCRLMQKFLAVANGGFLDTLKLSRELFPELRSHKQKDLVSRFLDMSYDAHKAVKGRVLQELYMKWNPDEQDVAGVVVFFDLETTGLDTKRCHILQLAAKCGGREFNRFILPYRNIDDDASRVNGFTTCGGYYFNQRSLLLHGRPVAAVLLRHALSDFIIFLSSFQAPLLLAAHNAKRFDVPVLTRSLQNCLLLQKFRAVANGGFLDTLKLSRELFPDLSCHKLSYLVSRSPYIYYNAHDAVEDVRVLQELYMKWKPHEQDVRSCTFYPNTF